MLLCRWNGVKGPDWVGGVYGKELDAATPPPDHYTPDSRLPNVCHSQPRHFGLIVVGRTEHAARIFVQNSPPETDIDHNNRNQCDAVQNDV